MVDFVKWISTFSTNQIWIMFLVVCLLMALAPYFGRIKRVISILIKREKAQILDFSWRIAPDHLIHRTAEKEYFYTGSKEVVYEGCPIILTWNVTGAYKIDISPGFNSLKENALITLVKPRGNEYTLTAFTLKGKLRAHVAISDECVKRIPTAHLGGANPFQQKEKRIAVSSLTKSTYIGQSYSHATVNSKISISKNKAKALFPQTRRIDYKSADSPQKFNIMNYFWKQKIVRGFGFRPSRYNQALELNTLTQKNESI